MVRARGYVQRTRSPRSRRKNGIGAGRGVPRGQSRPSRTGSRTNREGRKRGRKATIAAKEGGTAGPPPAFLVPPVTPCKRAYRA